ncbi:hypothetical protein MASR2M12_22580 [Bacteroidales bacterium]
MLNKIFEKKLFGIEAIAIGAPSLDGDVMPVKAVLVNLTSTKLTAVSASKVYISNLRQEARASMIVFQKRITKQSILIFT